MIEIKEIPLSMLLKMETKNLVNKVVSIFEKHNPEELRLQDFQAILQAQKAKVKLLIEPYGKHQLTEVLARLHEKRLDYASLIVMKRNALLKVDNKETQELAQTTQWLSNQFLTKLGRKSRNEVTVMLEVFFSNLKMDENAEVLEAFVKLGLDDYLNDLEKTNNEFQKLRSKRSLDIKNRPPIGDVLIEREAQRILRLFFSHVNTYQQTFKDIDYSSFINDLNVILTEHSKTIRTRIATNKRRARKKAAAAAKLKAEASKAKDKLKIEPGSKIEDKPQTNNSNKLDKSVGVSSLNTDSTDNTLDSTSTGKKEKNRQGDSSKKDLKSKEKNEGKVKKGLKRPNKKNGGGRR